MQALHEADADVLPVQIVIEVEDMGFEEVDVGFGVQPRAPSQGDDRAADLVVSALGRSLPSRTGRVIENVTGTSINRAMS